MKIFIQGIYLLAAFGVSYLVSLRCILCMLILFACLGNPENALSQWFQ